jgi:hypothetical protein
MIAGFATYQALEELGAQTFEGYPYLAFRLWISPNETLPPKRKRSSALAARQQILKRIAATANVEMPAPSKLDHADAAILALTVATSSVRHGAIFKIESPTEGRFIIALDRIDAGCLGAELRPEKEGGSRTAPNQTRAAIASIRTTHSL